MVIDRSGNVGIGTTSPSSRLEVAGAAYSDALTYTTYAAGGATRGVTLGGFNSDYGYLGFGAKYFSAGNYTATDANPGILASSNGGFVFYGDISKTPGSTYTPTARVTITNAGNVGIGTTTPGSLLSVQGIANFTTATSTFQSTGGINLTAGCFAVNGVCVGGGGSGSGTVGSGTTGQFPYYAANGTTLSATSSLFLSATGRIGVGTTSPAELLTIADGNGWISNSSGNSLLYFGALKNNYIGRDATNNGLALSTGGQTRLFVTDAGSVGIGTTTPTTQFGTKLAVAGPIYVGGASTTATSTFEGNARVIGNLAVGSGTTWIKDNATSSFNGGVNVAGDIELSGSFSTKHVRSTVTRVYYNGATWTKPAGLASVQVYVVGGGGGGGSANNGTGGNGGQSSFTYNSGGTSITANGGAGAAGVGGAGGSASGGDTNTTGGSGWNTVSTYGGGGGAHGPTVPGASGQGGTGGSGAGGTYGAGGAGGTNPGAGGGGGGGSTFMNVGGGGGGAGGYAVRTIVAASLGSTETIVVGGGGGGSGVGTGGNGGTTGNGGNGASLSSGGGGPNGSGTAGSGEYCGGGAGGNANGTNIGGNGGVANTNDNCTGGIGSGGSGRGGGGGGAYVTSGGGSGAGAGGAGGVVVIIETYDSTELVTGLSVSNSGNISIGTSTPSAKFSVTQSANNATGGLWIAETDNTDFRSIYMNTSGVMSFYGGDTGGSLNTATLSANGTWTNASDRAYKENIEDLHYGLDTISKLQPRSYTYKGTQNQGMGFIAQELRELVPEVVYGTDGSYSVDYGSLSALALMGVKELDLRTSSLINIGTSTAASTMLTIDSANRQVGIGVSTPTHMLTVGGDVAAVRFLAPVAAPDFIIGSTTITTAIPSEVLTLDGANVDLYKLSTYALAKTQLLATQVGALDITIDEIKDRLALLEEATEKLNQTTQLSIFGIQSTQTSTAEYALEDLGLALDMIASTTNATTSSSTPGSVRFATSFWKNVFAKVSEWIGD
ncbi:MAG: tail fiber domain-containing protein, partial [Actinomycetota bacterium]